MASPRIELATLLLCISVGPSACGGSSTGACGAGRTMLDGVCVREAVADYVACVRAQGARLGEEKSKKLGAEASYAGAKASAVADLKDTLARQYSVSDANTLEVIRTCGAVANPTAGGRQFSGFKQYYKCATEGATLLGDKGSKEGCLAACQAEAGAVGCWYMDGTNGFPRECRVCKTEVTQHEYPNDWGGSFQ